MMPNSIVTNVICLFCASINKFYLILSFILSVALYDTNGPSK